MNEIRREQWHEERTPACEPPEEDTPAVPIGHVEITVDVEATIESAAGPVSDAR